MEPAKESKEAIGDTDTLLPKQSQRFFEVGLGIGLLLTQTAGFSF